MRYSAPNWRVTRPPTWDDAIMVARGRKGIESDSAIYHSVKNRLNVNVWSENLC